LQQLFFKTADFQTANEKNLPFSTLIMKMVWRLSKEPI